MMIIDVHTHVFPDGLAARALATMEAFAARNGIRAAEQATVSALRASMQRNGIAYAVTLPVATRAEQVASVNRFVIEELRHEPGMLCFGALHPQCAAWEAEIARLAAAGIKGVKFHPEFQEFAIDTPAMIPVYRALADAGLLVLFHMGEEYFAHYRSRGTPAMLVRVLEQVPGLRVIAAHAGAFMRWEEVLAVLAGHPRVWFDLAYCAGVLPDEMRQRLCAAHGYERVLLGSDFPWVSQDATIAYVRRWGLPAEQEAGVLGGNAAKLLGIG